MDDENFILFDDGDGNKIIGFGTYNFPKKLYESQIILINGTFRIIPSLLVPLYTINSFYKDRMMPFIYILLYNKQQSTYIRIFDLIKSCTLEIGKIFHPHTFQLDFERVAINAAQYLFPDAEVRGCHYHFT